MNIFQMSECGAWNMRDRSPRLNFKSSHNAAMWMRVVIVLVFLAGCGGKSFDYHPDTEIPQGPGVFSGEKGDFTIYDSESAKTAKADQSKSDPNAPAASVSEPPPATLTSEPVDAEEYREFREFQKWKQEKKEFEAFQQWKKSVQGAREYEEFLEWKRWREYKQWQEKQQAP
jgi:hypothetical protein